MHWKSKLVHKSQVDKTRIREIFLWLPILNLKTSICHWLESVRIREQVMPRGESWGGDVQHKWVLTEIIEA